MSKWILLLAIATFLTLPLPATAVNISYCWNSTPINVSGTYTLTNNISSFGAVSPCLFINASNVVLDCQGHTITCGGGGCCNDGVNYGRISNLEIKNCRMEACYDSFIFETPSGFDGYCNNCHIHDSYFQGGRFALAFSGNNSLIKDTDGTVTCGGYGNTLDRVNGSWDDLGGINTVAKNSYVTDAGVQCKNCTIENNVINQSLGFYESDGSIARNNTIYRGFNLPGLVIERTDNAQFYSNRILPPSSPDFGYAIVLQDFAINPTYSQFNLIYDNYINSSNGVRFYQNHSLWTNYWSIAKTTRKNIIGGAYTGGNYWANPNGTGYSQTCSDTAPADGFCDIPLNMSSTNVDYLPLGGVFLLECGVCDIDNVVMLDLGAIPVMILCGFLNMMFCIPYIFVFAVCMAAVAGILLLRVRGR